jgi:hypothetical protein
LASTVVLFPSELICLVDEEGTTSGVVDLLDELFRAGNAVTCKTRTGGLNKLAAW